MYVSNESDWSCMKEVRPRAAHLKREKNGTMTRQGNGGK